MATGHAQGRRKSYLLVCMLRCRSAKSHEIIGNTVSQIIPLTISLFDFCHHELIRVRRCYAAIKKTV